MSAQDKIDAALANMKAAHEKGNEQAANEYQRQAVGWASVQINEGKK